MTPEENDATLRRVLLEHGALTGTHDCGPLGGVCPFVLKVGHERGVRFPHCKCPKCSGPVPACEEVARAERWYGTRNRGTVPDLAVEFAHVRSEEREPWRISTIEARRLAQDLRAGGES